MPSLEKKIPEIVGLRSICDKVKDYGEVFTLGSIKCHKNTEVPLIGIRIGSKKPEAPCIGLFAGVHGLERIGTRVVMAALESLLARFEWDESTRLLLEKVRIIAVPMINPYGFWNNTRSNGSGVDLMRNAPVEANRKDVAFLVGGHRISPHLPWYRGQEGRGQEFEVARLCEFIEQQAFQSEFLITLDCHSGFGYKDRLWFPYAKTKTPFPHLAQVYEMKSLFEGVYPHHIYHIEPQSAAYCTHGDVWDYLYDKFHTNKKSVYLPLTLEMGSWLWVKKNPSQFFSLTGPFNPIVQHREHRVLRRHLPFFDFLIRATAYHRSWVSYDQIRQKAYLESARTLWY